MLVKNLEKFRNEKEKIALTRTPTPQRQALGEHSSQNPFVYICTQIFFHGGKVMLSMLFCICIFNIQQ